MTARRQPLLLWSTTTFIGYCIQRDYLGSFYVWCTPVFSGENVGSLSPGGSQARSSDPATIYRQLHGAVSSSDTGDLRISSHRSTFTALAVKWQEEGKIDSEERDEIIAIMNEASLRDWRPMIFAIPYHTVAHRLKRVTIRERASKLNPEYVITDLKEGEFDIIEPMQCT